MNEERLEAYLKLIDALLKCSTGEEPEILNKHHALIDLNLIHLMHQVAAELAERGDQARADWIQDYALSLFSTFEHSSQSSMSSIEMVVSNLFQQGNEQFQAGQFQAALQSWEQALSICQNLNKPQWQASTLGNLGKAYDCLGQHQKAIECHQKSLELSKHIRDPKTEMIALIDLGHAFDAMGQYTKAIESHEEALNLASKLGEKNLEIGALSGLGNAYDSLHQYRKAIDYYLQQLVISHDLKDELNQAYALNNLGNAYRKSGKLQKGIEYLEQSLIIKQKLNDLYSTANTFGSLGNMYCSLGQYQRAIECHLQQLKIYQKVGDRHGEASALNSIGMDYQFLNQYSQSIEYLQQALEVGQEISSRQIEATSLGELGNAYCAQEQFQKGLKCYEKQLEISQEIGDRLGVASALGNQGVAYYKISDYQKAIEFSQKQLVISEEITNLKSKAESLNNLGAAFLRLGKLLEAEEKLCQAVEVQESLRGDGLRDAYKVSIFETQSSCYRLLQEALISQNKVREALEVSERGRARALVELLASKSSPDPNRLDRLAPYLDCQQISKIARDRKTTIVEYSIIYNDLSQESSILIWVVSSAGEINFHQVDLSDLRKQTQSARPLADLILQNMKFLSSKEEQNGDSKSFKEKLYMLLINPIADLLPTDSNALVAFIPQQSLFLLPFSVLQDLTGKYLDEQFTILTSPSIQLLEISRSINHPETEHGLNALVVGNPKMPSIAQAFGEPPQMLRSLPGSETEAIAVANLLNTEPILGSRATKKILFSK